MLQVLEVWQGYETSRYEEVLERLDCKVCRGVARFCKLSVCPFYRHLLHGSRLTGGREWSYFGPSPPTLIVGERGYPRVSLGPAVSIAPQLNEVLSIGASSWLERSIETLVEARLGLLFGMAKMGVADVRKGSKLVESLATSAMSVKPVEMELELSGRPIVRAHFHVRSEPYGPTARLLRLRYVGEASIPRTVDRIVGDHDLRAIEAMKELLERGIDEYYMSRLLSAGLLGRKRERKMVPTEWSITAVDDVLSKHYLSRIKDFEQISDYLVYEYAALHNRALVILLPTPWMYELLEGWMRYMRVYADHELLRPRSSYAEDTGGAFYAVRLALTRSLYELRRQAGALVFFEVEEGWIPLGVWRFREIVRRALRTKPERFETLEEALGAVKKRLRLPLSWYLSRSKMVPLLRTQRSLESYQL